MTFSAGPSFLKRHCCTWNVSFVYARIYQLSLSLKKSRIFSKRFEFVGIDVCPDGNRPAMSKHHFLVHWPLPEFVQDVANIVGFAQFYGKFTPQFELRIAPLCDLKTKLEYTKPFVPHWTTAAQDSFDDIQQAILSDPCLKRFDHNRLIVLRSDFLSKGFGYAICQPRNDNPLTTVMDAYCSGLDFSFMTKDSTAVLHPAAFVAKCCRRNEVRLHSHLGEGFSGDWAMNKCRHMLFGQCFVWTTDCYAIQFILFYDGANLVILRLQMHLMCWDVDIVHQNNHYIADADYWLRLGAGLCFDPLFKKYLDLTWSLCTENPPPTSLPMQPENMPYYHGPHVTTPPDYTADTTDATHYQAIASALLIDDCCGLSHLSNVPVKIGDFEKTTPKTARALHNDKFPCYAQQVLQFIHGGHFASTVQYRNLPFQVRLA